MIAAVTLLVSWSAGVTVAAQAAALETEPCVACGPNCSGAITADGTLWMWGENTLGQLGLGDLVDRDSATRVGTGTDWARLACGFYHCLALKTDGTLWSWGANWLGQLGLGDTSDRTQPTRVGAGTSWEQIAAGSEHSLALTAGGDLFAWGYNGEGQLGLGTTESATTPQPVAAAYSWLHIACGKHFSAAVRGDHSLWLWGDNEHGQLGLGDTVDRTSPQQPMPGTTWLAVACGEHHVLAVRSDGTLWSWGYNALGQLGLGDTVDRTTPQQVGTADDWADVSCGAWHSFAIDQQGHVWAWGENGSLQTGRGSAATYTSPGPLEGLSAELTWQSLDGGFYHTLGCSGAGGVYVGGNDGYGQLGLPSSTTSAFPYFNGVWLFDGVPPTTTADVTPDPGPSGWNVTGPVVVDFSAADIPSGVDHTEYSTDGGASWTSGTSCTAESEGVTTVLYRSVDKAGNVETTKSLEVKLDETVPVTAVSGIPDGWGAEPVLVVFTPAAGPSGVASVQYRLDGGEPQDAAPAGGGTWTASVGSSGVHTITCRSTSVAGLAEDWQATRTVRIDTIAPTVVDDAPSGWVKEPLTVNLTPQDGGGSGIAKTQYRPAGSTTWLDAVNHRFTVTTPGIRDYQYRALDLAGNASAVGSVTARIDTSPPTTAAARSPTPNTAGWNNVPVTLTFTGTDSLSGVGSTEYSLDGGATWTKGASAVLWGNGIARVHYRSIDIAGNVEAAKSLDVAIDTTRPVPRALAEVRARRDRRATFRLRIDDAVSPSAHVTVKIYKVTRLMKTLRLGLKPTNSEIRCSYLCRLVPGRYTWKVFATDLAGNKQSEAGARTLVVR